MHALRRGAALVQRGVPQAVAPEWLFGGAPPDAEEACAVASIFATAERTFRQRMRHRIVHQQPEWRMWDAIANHRPTVLPEDDRPRLVVIARLAFGAAVEAAICDEAVSIAPPGPRKTMKPAAECRLSRLYADGLHAAAWTSAHATHISDAALGLETPNEPSIFSVPSALTELDLSDFFHRRASTKMVSSKNTVNFLNLLNRSTNPGSRGWTSLLSGCLGDCCSIRSVISNAMLVSLTGMHAMIHPALRPPWAMRLHALRACAEVLESNDCSAFLIKQDNSAKEASRRMLAGTMAASCATKAAMEKLSHPVGLMNVPPSALPHFGQECASAAFTHAGALMLSKLHTRHDALADAKPEDVQRQFMAIYTSTLDEALNEAFAIKSKMAYSAAWLGKGTASVSPRTPLVDVASDVFAASFRASFVPFWCHGLVNQTRVSRLDSVQHAAIHDCNNATRLAAMLTEADALAVQAQAISCPSAGILNIAEVGEVLGIPISSQATFASSLPTRSAVDNLRILSSAGACAASKLLNFARVAALSEELLVVDLGFETKRLQARALLRRLQRGDRADAMLTANDTEIDAALAALPIHSTLLHICTDCKRVANSCVCDGGKNQLFNEIGISASMLNKDGEVADIRCAKRSSAALRSAVAFEGSAKQKQIESCDRDDEKCANLLSSDSTNDDESGLSARIRRDSKSALEQRRLALACGDQPMATVPIVAKAVRVYGAFYALCSFCASLVKVTPAHRFEAEICCLRCDAKMLGCHSIIEKLEKTQRERQRRPICRYCGKIDENEPSKWKAVKAPLDTSGDNASLPPNLRVVFFCPSHHRIWIPAAMKTLTSRVILSHIAINARPTEHVTLKSAEFEPAKRRRRRKVT